MGTPLGPTCKYIPYTYMDLGVSPKMAYESDSWELPEPLNRATLFPAWDLAWTLDP